MVFLFPLLGPCQGGPRNIQQILLGWGQRQSRSPGIMAIDVTGGGHLCWHHHSQWLNQEASKPAKVSFVFRGGDQVQRGEHCMKSRGQNLGLHTCYTFYCCPGCFCRCSCVQPSKDSLLLDFFVFLVSLPPL